MTIEASKSKHSNEYLHRGIAERSFTKQFRLSDDIKVTGADLKDGLLTVTFLEKFQRLINQSKLKLIHPA